MTTNATITFSQTGVQPPVYVVTSLSEPPWETLEMNVEDEQTASGDLVFARHFDNVAEGNYQYKIRIGDGHWVVDESKDSATDEHGNRNNVIHVKSANKAESDMSTSNTATESDQTALKTQHDQSSHPLDPREDTTADASDETQPPSVPIPFVTVEKVTDKEQPEYGDVESRSLDKDDIKRTADAEPDFETITEESSDITEPPKSPQVPLLVVEKTDNMPVYGDDFGEDATTAQKVAHDMRAADASPDRLIITPEPHTEPGSADDQAAPLFRHESFQADESPSTSAMDIVDNMSVQSSNEQTSSEDVVYTPSDPNESQDDDESNRANNDNHHSEHNNGPFLSHELEPEEGDGDELSNGPLLSHETGLNGDNGSYDEDEDELDAAPLLPHEAGFSQYNGSELTANNDFMDDNVLAPRHYTDEDKNRRYKSKTLEPDEAPTFTHDDLGNDDDDDYEEDDTPLLPHERDSAISDHYSPDEDGPFMMHQQRSLGQETDNAKTLFGGSGRPGIFRTRTNSSSLPHKLPQSDADDENLSDPFLEQFPTNRERILERVATIGLHLPEDQTMEDSIHSPVMSVLSQACSSIELAPVKSYTSLASVPEVENSDEDEEDEDDEMESLPSPMVINMGRIDFARDPHVTPMPDENKRLWLANKNSDPAPIPRSSIESSKAENVDKDDGTKDAALSNVQEGIATPATMFNPITPPLTPENRSSSTSNKDATSVSESQVRQRQMLQDNVSKDSSPSFDGQDEGDKSNRATTPSNLEQPDQGNETLFQSVYRNVIGPVGDKRRASATIFAVGTAAAAYYAFAST